MDYFELIRERMFQTVEAYYGPSVEAIAELRERYGADYLLVRKGPSKRSWWGMQPFTTQ